MLIAANIISNFVLEKYFEWKKEKFVQDLFTFLLVINYSTYEEINIV